MASARSLGVVLLLLCGCFQQLLEIRAVDTDDGVAFELPALADGMANQKRYELLDLMVTKLKCQSDCTLWSVVRAPGPGIAPLNRARIAYGEPRPGTVLRTHAGSLTPGSYAVSATVQEVGAQGELVRSLVMDSTFEIARDSSGKLRVVGRTGETGGCK